MDLIKQALYGLLPTLSGIVNLSLDTATFSTSWKVAFVKPLLKKFGLELITSNYRPVSNLSFLSKLVEKCALKGFNHNSETNNLMPDYQSSYRNNYSYKTALLKIVNDLLWNLENRMITPLVTIDLSVAFDTIYHNILLDILSTKLGIKGTALDWFGVIFKTKEASKSKLAQTDLQW